MVYHHVVHRAHRFERAIIATSILLILTCTCSAQGPQFDVGAPPGAAGGASTVGQPLGSANFPDSQTGSIAPISGKPGPGGSHAPAAGLASPGVPVFRTTGAQASIRQSAQPIVVPQYGDLELPPELRDYGTPEGMNLDTAIELLVKQNLDLEAARLEIPMADADVLTANLRANPIFYADTQLIPYGHFSFLRPGGPPQSDININYPLDITFKRQARTRSAREAKSVTEAQLKDAVRNQIDNLYTVYEDVVSAGLTLKFSEVYVAGIRRLFSITEELVKKEQIKPADLEAVKASVMKAELQVKESKQAKIKANRALALILNMPLDDVEKIDVFDPVGQLRPLPLMREELVNKALAARPDLLAIKIGVRRADSDLRLAKANAVPDVYVLYQPYTFQNNTYLGVPSAYSWTLGLTASIPLYNRNQGNVTRAKINIDQTQLQVESQKRIVISDVLNAAQELEQSLVVVVQLREEILPASRKVRDSAFNRFRGGETSALEFLDAQQDFNDNVRLYRDAMVRHRRAILDLNTAVGERVLP
jgi:outer membrane protein, heavy metal efflux system